MADQSRDPKYPSRQSLARQGSRGSRSSQDSDLQRRSRELSQPPGILAEEVRQVIAAQPRSSQASQDSRSSLPAQSLRWSQGAGLPMAQEAWAGNMDPMNLGFARDLQSQGYHENRISTGEQNTHLFLQQLQQGQGGLFEASYQDGHTNLMGQLSFSPRDDRFIDAHHGPYLRDDPALQFLPSDLGFGPFAMESPEPHPRELAVQNAKAYLLQTSVSCDLSL